MLLFSLILPYYYYYYYCIRHMAPVSPQPSVRCAPIYKSVGQHCCIWYYPWKSRSETF
jgi:hypothetical protein